MELKDLNKIIGKRIADARDLRGLKQVELAKRVDKPRQHLSQIELGHQQPRADFLVQIADVLNVSLDYLTGRKDDPSIKQRTAVETQA